MVKQHLKRFASPKSWNIKKKNITFITRPNPGPHKVNFQMPINVILRDLIGVAKSTKEVKFILHNKDCLIDGNICHDYRRPAGLMDVISIHSKNQSYRVLINKKNKLYLVDLTPEQSKLKLVKIGSKTTLKNNKLQLNCTDGRNILISDNKKYEIGDSLLISLPEQTIKEHFSFQKHMTIFLTSGSHVGEIGKIEEIKEDSSIIVKNEEGTFTTKKDFAFIVGKTEPVIKV